MNPTSPEWIYDEANWRLDEPSKKVFENARDGQGFAGVVYIEKDKKTGRCIARATLCPAFNGEDGLAREDKWGSPYQKIQQVDSKRPFATMGVGIIHKESVSQEVLKTALQDEKFILTRKLKVTVEKKYPDYPTRTPADQQKMRDLIINNYYDKLIDSQSLGDLIDEVKGYTLGFGVIKGAESHDPKDYIVVPPIQEKRLIKKLQDFYIQRKSDRFDEFPPNKKCLVFVKDEKNTDAYYVFYIQNQKLVHTPRDPRSNHFPVISCPFKIKNNERVTLSLEALNLNKLFYSNSFREHDKY